MSKSNNKNTPKQIHDSVLYESILNGMLEEMETRNKKRSFQPCDVTSRLKPFAIMLQKDGEYESLEKAIFKSLSEHKRLKELRGGDYSDLMFNLKNVQFNKVGENSILARIFRGDLEMASCFGWDDDQRKEYQGQVDYTLNMKGNREYYLVDKNEIFRGGTPNLERVQKEKTEKGIEPIYFKVSDSVKEVEKA